MKLIPENELLIGLQNSDHQCFCYLYEKHWQKLYMIACKRLDNNQDAEEVVQDVFCNLWRRRNSLVLKSNFEAYFAVAVKYEVINRLAKRAHERLYQSHAMRHHSELAETTGEQVASNEFLSRLEHVINDLPEKCGKVFRLSRNQGYSHKKIAEEMNISMKTVESHLTKALRTLRASLSSIFF